MPATRSSVPRRSLTLTALLLVCAGMLIAPALARGGPTREVRRHSTRSARCLIHPGRRHGRRARVSRRCHKVHRPRTPAGSGSGNNNPTSPTGTQPASPTGSQPTSPTGTQTTPSDPSPTPSSLYWGATIGSQFTGTNAPWDWNAVTDFQNTDVGGKPISIASSGALFYSSQYCGGYCGFQTSLFTTVRSNGVIPWISWQSTSDTGASGFTDAEVAGGSQDSYITQWAQAAKAWGHPFFLRFDWEMNASWFPWGMGVNGNTAADYVAMWRHVHNIFTSVGVTNVTWVWCPNIDPGNTFAPVSSLYPGDAYVDWTCLDGYNGDVPWTSFQALFQSTYNLITGTIASSKPMIVGETGSTETGGSKADWITSMFSALPTSFPKIHGLLWYDVNGPGPGGYTDWPIESSSSSEAAFAAGIGSSAFVGNNYANLNSSPIPPPA